VLKKSDGNNFGSFSEVSTLQPTDDRSLWTVLHSRVTDLSLSLGTGAEFFNTIDREQTYRQDCNRCKNTLESVASEV